MKSVLLLVLVALLGSAAASYYQNYPKLEIFGLGGCGDGVLSEKEECDDFNRFDGDGCDHNCRSEGVDPLQANGVFTLRNQFINDQGEATTESNGRIDISLYLNDLDGSTISQVLARLFAGAQTQPLINLLLGFFTVNQVQIANYREMGIEFANGDMTKEGQDVQGNFRQASCGDGMVSGNEECDITDAGCTSCRVTNGYLCNNVEVRVAMVVQSPDDGDEGLLGRMKITDQCQVDSDLPSPYDASLFGITNFFGYVFNPISTVVFLTDDVTVKQANRAILDGREERACWKDLPQNECLDGNDDNGDGCDDECQIESGWECFTQTAYLDAAVYFSEGENVDEIRGFGSLLFTMATCAQDGATSVTLLQKRSTSSDDSDSDDSDSHHHGKHGKHGKHGRSGKSSRSSSSSSSGEDTTCGDRVVEGEETCDDGNRLNGDGCSRRCRLETGYEAQSITIDLTYIEYGDLNLRVDDGGSSNNLNLNLDYGVVFPETTGGPLQAQAARLEFIEDVSKDFQIRIGKNDKKENNRKEESAGADKFFTIIISVLGGLLGAGMIALVVVTKRRNADAALLHSSYGTH